MWVTAVGARAGGEDGESDDGGVRGAVRFKHREGMGARRESPAEGAERHGNCGGPDNAARVGKEVGTRMVD